MAVNEDFERIFRPRLATNRGLVTKLSFWHHQTVMVCFL